MLSFKPVVVLGRLVCVCREVSDEGEEGVMAEGSVNPGVFPNDVVTPHLCPLSKARLVAFIDLAEILIHLILWIQLVSRQVCYTSTSSGLTVITCRGLWGFALIGLGLDLIPGLVTVFEIMTDTSDWKQSIKYVCHPYNLYKSCSFQECHAKTLSFHQCVYISTLIVWRILPLPWDLATWPSVTWSQSVASLWSRITPFVAVVLAVISSSFASVEDTSTVSHNIFRFCSFVFVLSFWADYFLALLMLLFVVSMVIFMIHGEDIKSDPTLLSFYSLSYPTVELKGLKVSLPEKSSILAKLVVLSDVILMVMNWTTFLVLVLFNELIYSPFIRFGRDLLLGQVLILTGLGFISLTLTPLKITANCKKYIDSGTVCSVVTFLILLGMTSFTNPLTKVTISRSCGSGSSLEVITSQTTSKALDNVIHCWNDTWRISSKSDFG